VGYDLLEEIYSQSLSYLNDSHSFKEVNNSNDYVDFKSFLQFHT